jgi:hypothetical protein
MPVGVQLSALSMLHLVLVWLHGLTWTLVSCLSLLQVAELNAKVQELEAQFNAAVEDKEAAIKESERCQLKLQLANRLINALASEGEHTWGVGMPSCCHVYWFFFLQRG